MKWLLRTDGTEAGTVLLNADTKEPVIVPDGCTMVVDLHIRKPPWKMPPFPPGSDILGDLAAFRARGTKPPVHYNAWIAPEGAHKAHRALIRVCHPDASTGLLEAIEAEVEVIGEGHPVEHQSMALVNQPKGTPVGLKEMVS